MVELNSTYWAYSLPTTLQQSRWVEWVDESQLHPLGSTLRIPHCKSPGTRGGSSFRLLMASKFSLKFQKCYLFNANSVFHRKKKTENATTVGHDRSSGYST
jgi:hypothetical protein